MPTKPDRRKLSLVLLLLLEHGAEVNAYNGSTLLIGAAVFSPDLIPLLLDHGAWINTRNWTGRTALYAAVEHGANTEAIQQLLQHGADPNIGDKWAKTPLQLALQANRSDIVVLLRQAGARQ